MNTTPIPTVTVTARRPSKAHAGFATAIKMNGIDFIVITARAHDLPPLMQAVGFVAPFNVASVQPVAVLAKHSVKVVAA